MSISEVRDLVDMDLNLMDAANNSVNPLFPASQCSTPTMEENGMEVQGNGRLGRISE